MRWPLVGGGLSLLLFLLLLAAVLRAKGPLPLDLWVAAMATGLRDPVLNEVMIDASYLCVWQVLVAGGIAASLWLLLWRRWLLTVTIWVSLLGSDLVASAIKAHLERPRPDQAVALLPASGYSFPSGHTFSSLAFYGLLGVMLLLSARPGALRWGLVAGIAAISGLVGFSRIYVGAHWPTDVLGSWLLGIAWLCALGVGLSRSLGARRAGGASRTFAMLASAVAIFCIWSAIIVALAILDPAVRGGGSVGEVPNPSTSSGWHLERAK